MFMTFHNGLMFFATSLLFLFFIRKCHHESSRKPQHSKWNCCVCKQATAQAHVRPKSGVDGMNKTKHSINHERPCTTTLKFKLLSSLFSFVLSCLLLFSVVFVLSSLSSSLLSLSAFFLCLSLSVSPCDVVCCGVWCVSCGTVKNPCVHSKRPLVCRHNAHTC